MSPDGRMGLHHLKERGDPDRPADAKVETFRQHVAREENRKMILEANGVQTTPAAYREDAQRLKRWLDAHAASPEAVIVGPDGERWLFRDARSRLLRNYAETPDWVLAAHRFYKAVRDQVHWSDPTAQKPELWK